MPVLDHKYFSKIETFNQAAEQWIQSGDYVQAIKEYQKAWNTLPEPKQLWDTALWVKMGQAECFLAMEEFDQAKQKLLDAILCAGAVNNPLLHLYLGICFYETGDQESAFNEFKMAYELEGENIFQEGDENYRDFLLNRLKA